jgi:hypothetical protein
VIGLLAITSLTTADVIVAKAVFDDHEAGIYGSASLVGRMILYLPAAIVTVLLPKVSARVTRGEGSGDILAASIGVTLAASALLTIAYAVGAGPGHPPGVRLGVRRCLQPALPLRNRNERLRPAERPAHLSPRAQRDRDVVAAARRRGGQLGGYMVLHDSPRQLLAVSIATMVALVVTHEVFIERSLTSAVARLFRL